MGPCLLECSVVPSPAGSLSAVIVSGGKQYRVAPGDRILVDRLAAEAGSEISLDRVLLVADGDDVKVGSPAVDGVTVVARVIRDTRGPKIDVLRYKSKKRVRVHRGARADLTAIEILEIGGKGRVEKPKKAAEPAEKPARKAAKPKAGAAEKAEAVEATEASETTAAPAAEEAPKPARRARAAKAEAKPEEDSDGA